MSALPRLLRLARAMLGIARTSKRPIAIALALFPMSACILPLAPEFQDPPAAQNYPPVIVDSDPPIGEVVTTTTFSVIVRELNLGDDLYVRWVADYPPYAADKTRTLNDPNTKVPHPVDMATDFDLPSVTVDCVLNELNPQITMHQIMVIVADRPFVSTDAQPAGQIDLALVTPPGFAVKGSWTLNLGCNQ
jgi:hypothetical protein